MPWQARVSYVCLGLFKSLELFWVSCWLSWLFLSHFWRVGWLSRPRALTSTTLRLLRETLAPKAGSLAWFASVWTSMCQYWSFSSWWRRTYSLSYCFWWKLSTVKTDQPRISRRTGANFLTRGRVWLSLWSCLQWHQWETWQYMWNWIRMELFLSRWSSYRFVEWAY